MSYVQSKCMRLSQWHMKRSKDVLSLLYSHLAKENYLVKISEVSSVEAARQTGRRGRQALSEKPDTESVEALRNKVLDRKQ